MSGRSPTSRQLITAGLVGVGVGVLAAGVGYAIATRSPTNCLAQPIERRMYKLENRFDREGTTEYVDAIPYHENDQCKICGKDMSSEPSVSLACNHSFHRKCLFSSYVVQIQVNKGTTFQCPFDACQVGISENILESLIAFH